MGRKEKILELFRALLLDADDEVIERLAKYVELWRKWNEKLRLTSKMTEDEFLKTQLGTSLLLWRLFEEPGSYLDVGSGAGLPAIPLSLFLRDKTVLVESNYKKAAFLSVCKRELKISWLDVYNERIEEAREIKKLVPFRYVTARAVASIKNILNWTSDFIGDDTSFILPKGDKAKAELEKARQIMSSLGLGAKVEKLSSPFSDRPYQVIVLKKVH